MKKEPVSTNHESPDERQARLYAEAEAENAVDLAHDFQETLTEKSVVGRDSIFLLRGSSETRRVARRDVIARDSAKSRPVRSMFGFVRRIMGRS